MPAIQHGILSTEIYPQPGFTVAQDDKGTYTGQGVYAIRKDALNNPTIQEKFNIGTSLTDLDGDPDKQLWSFLTISQASRAYTEGDLIFLNVQFTGSSGPQFPEDDGISEAALPRYSLDMTSGESPFSQHPKWIALSVEFQTFLGLLLQGVYYYDIASNELKIPEDGNSMAELLAEDLTFTGDAIVFATLIQQGELTYHTPSISWTETTTGTEKLTTAQLNKLSKISTPRGNPPEPNNRNWMLDGGTQDQVGETDQTRLTWILSGREPFSEFLYGD
jgi:hypothetical protein